jgi:large subunit ribosomal protein L17
LFRDVAAKLEIVQVDTHVLVGNRLGDNADMAMIELVDFNELTLVVKKKLKSKKGRGGKAKKADEATEV